MKAREENGKIRVYTQLPKIWNNHINFHLLEDSTHEDNGFYNYEQPEKTEHQKYGEIVFIDNKFVRQVVDMTAEEISEYEENKRNELIDQLEANGVDVTYNEHVFHFSRDLANQFLGVAQLTERLGGIDLEWKNKEKIFVTVPLNDAYTISATALQLFKNIHLENS